MRNRLLRLKGLGLGLGHHYLFAYLFYALTCLRQERFGLHFRLGLQPQINLHLLPSWPPLSFSYHH